MGEVYRATDSKLGREVALKVLPAAFASDPDRLARFEREARLLAALNHPNVAQLYGFESVARDDEPVVHILVMELAPGEELQQRLSRGSIPVDEALEIALQIAEALEQATRRGSCIAISSPPTSSWVRRGRSSSWTWAWRRRTNRTTPWPPRPPSPSRRP